MIGTENIKSNLTLPFQGKGWGWVQSANDFLYLFIKNQFAEIQPVLCISIYIYQTKCSKVKIQILSYWQYCHIPFFKSTLQR
ncbi:MAG: hypothetical protein HC803_06040 [Saprospiraceae bacterium]|nr:hypothetical protein [Saprospiraceae bacterium]